MCEPPLSPARCLEQVDDVLLLMVVSVGCNDGYSLCLYPGSTAALSYS